MQGIAHGMKPKRGGPSPQVARKLLSETSTGNRKKLAMNRS